VLLGPLPSGPAPVPANRWPSAGPEDVGWLSGI